jgi:3-hydroxybutyryl-CoA dehydrogenase
MKTSEPVIAVIGTGIMGRGIAQIATTSGLSVLLHDQSPSALESAVTFVIQQLERQVAKGKLTRAAGDLAISHLRPVSSPEELAGADIVIEAIAEDLAMKRALFATLEKIVSPAAILATNTSSLSVTSIARECAAPERVAGYHFFNPAPLMKVVEVIPGLRTDPSVIDALSRLAVRMGHRPIEAQDSPGFLINHIGRGLSTEGLRIVQEGIARPDQVDRLMRESAGFRMGPFQLLDLTGMDISINVMEQIYAAFHQEPRYRPSYLARRQVDAGLFGRKTGQGWYRYRDGVAEETPEEPAPSATPCPVWIEQTDPDAAAWLSELVAAAGWPLDAGATPNSESLCLVTPIGTDATITSVRLGLDATRTVAVDSLSMRGRRRTAMTTAVTDGAFRDAARHLLSPGPGVTMIHDSPGFIVPRIVATIVNIGCEIAQQRIASPDDIDAGARLGLGYPSGPLELGDAWNPRVILQILEEMSAFYGDPRFRPSPWLKRRALLGRSLKTAEA